MKVKCIDSKHWEKLLTFDKIYEVISISKCDDYEIIDDNNFQWWCEKVRFKPLSEIRNEKIDKLLAE